MDHKKHKLFSINALRNCPFSAQKLHPLRSLFSKHIMKTIMKLAAVGLIVAVQPVFAIAPPITAPDSGATAILTLISVGGLLVAKNILKKH